MKNTRSRQRAVVVAILLSLLAGLMPGLQTPASYAHTLDPVQIDAPQLPMAAPEAQPMAQAAPDVTIGGVDLGNLTDYVLFVADGNSKAKIEGSTPGWVGDIAVDGVQAKEETAGTVQYAGTMYTNDST